MIYVSGDGFAAGSYSAVNFGWASQDPQYTLKGNQPHPENLDISFSKQLSLTFHLPVRNDASIQKSWRKIIAETLEVINQNTVNYIIISWPNFYKGEVLFHNKSIPFDFKEVHNLKIAPDLRKAMHNSFTNFNLNDEIKEFVVSCNNLMSVLEDKQIVYLFMMGDTIINCPNLKAEKWLFDPYSITVKSWAGQTFTNSHGYLTVQGHSELSKLIALHLTNQL